MKRNFCIAIPEPQKAELKKLAALSGLTLSQYVEAVLRDAAATGDLFEVKITRKRK